MNHLSLVSVVAGSPDLAKTNGSRAAAADNTPPPTAPADCCPISAADEFSYRNPGVLGDSLVRASQHAVDAARRGDYENTERMLSWLADRTADAHAFDDHAASHLIEGITDALGRAVMVAKHNRANQDQPVDETKTTTAATTTAIVPAATTAATTAEPKGGADLDTTATTSPAPSGRVRVHRPRTP